MMNDDFDKLRPNDDEPEKPDDALDWLNALEENPSASSTQVVGSGGDDLPPARSDDPLSWLQEYGAPEEEEGDAPQPAISSGVTDFLQSDDLFEAADGEQGEPDWMQSAGVFSAPKDETAEAAPTEDLPPWLKEGEAASLDADLFSGLDEALGIAPGVPQPPQPAANVLASLQDDISDPVDDFFAQLSPPVSEDAPPEIEETSPLPEEDDLLSELKLTDPTSPGWFDQEVSQAAAPDEPNWLQDLGDLTPDEETPPQFDMADEPELAPAEDDFLAEMMADAGAKGQFGEKSSPVDFDTFDAPGLQDIDSLLASYENAPSLAQDDSGMTRADIDRLLSDDEVGEISARRSGEGRPPVTGLSPDAPDWLTELGSSVGSVDEVSAAAMVRKATQNERPVDELSDRLFALHEAGLELQTPSDTGSAEVIKTLLPGINQVIPAAPIKTGLPGITGDVALTSEQRDKINLLNTLVAVEQEKPRSQRPSAIDLTLENRNFDDLAEPDLELDEAAPAVVVAASVAPQRRVRLKIDRLLISLLVVVAVVLPFVVSGTRIGDLPPLRFTAGSRQQAAYDRVNSLRSGQMVLVAAEYGPTGAAELDSALDALLRHILMRGAHPVLVSGNAVGLLHAQNILEAIAQDSVFLNGMKRGTRPLVANTDFYIARYLVGEAIGLRDFGQNLGALISTDVKGQPTRLTASSLHDFGLVVLIAERAEDVRAWGEQIAPLAGQPLVIATGYSAAPLAEPYALSEAPGAVGGIGGMLVGYRDAYTYREMLDIAMFGARPTLPAATPAEPTAEATESVVLPGQTPSEPTVENAAATPAPTLQSESIEGTPNQADATLAPTESQPLDTTPSAAPPTPEPTTPGVTVQAVIKSDTAVNVREGPGTSFTPVTAVRPGTSVQVIGRNGDGTWIQIRTDDGKEGWVSAQLIDIQEPTIEPSPTREGASGVDPNAVVGLISDVSLFVPAQQQPEATPEVTPEATIVPAPLPTATPLVTVSVSASLPTYRDERWYSMTLGLMAIIVVIALGALVNIVRGLLRRGNK